METVDGSKETTRLPLRVFLCYASEDREFARQVAQYLMNQGADIQVIWDQLFGAGREFGELIRTGIAHAHVFLPIITPASHAKGWIHQEIGFATSVNIPIIPISIGTIPPQEMISSLQAVMLENVSDTKWQSRLKRHELDQLLGLYSDESLARYECAPLHQERTQMLVRQARYVLQTFGPARIYQRGALSSFHIPKVSTEQKEWRERYGGRKMDEYHCKLLLQERTVFEEHVRKCGCKLIINPELEFKDWGDNARASRLEQLLEFLRDARDYGWSVEVAIDSTMHNHENQTILGNYFFAESVTARPGEGYRQTILTTHAPSMAGRIASFERWMCQVWEACGRANSAQADGSGPPLGSPEYFSKAAKASLKNAIEFIEKLVAKLPRTDLSDSCQRTGCPWQK